jgi:undecaprenyl-diphosphatase
VAPWKALALGAIQGLTEFLPVSSSGHLVVAQALFGFGEPALFLDILLHVATLGSLVAFFRREILWMGSALLGRAGSPPGKERAQGRRFLLLLLVGTFPTALMGLLFLRPVERLFARPEVAGAMLMVTGAVLWATGWAPARGRGLEAMGLKDALLIGAAQGLALVPGLSRTGLTLAAALFIGLERELAGRYALLLGVPAVAGAALVGAFSAHGPGADPLVLALAMAVAFASGYGALMVVFRTVLAGRLRVFAPYCLAVGVVVLLVAGA